MPAVRDFSVAYESTTTDAGLTIPLCAYAENDLLIAFCVGDSGAPTWGCSNGVGTWNQLIAQNNSCSFVCYWKYAAASGEGDVVFTSTVNETYSGAVIALRDVYLSYSGGSPPTKANTTQASSTRFDSPTLTTAAADSLVLVGAASTATAPSLHVVEDDCQELCKVDGAAEGLGIGWFLQKAAGATAAKKISAMVGGAGVKFAIEVRAPSGGAAVVPTYPVTDASIYLTPSPGIAYASNTALAATADTNFGTSIAGKTCNDGTVATAVVDIGIDVLAFMSFAGVTNATTANQMSGAEGVVAAARYDVGDRNILAHFRHPTPAHNQRLTTLSSGRGVWLGMKSGATAAQDWKVWQVHGSDVPIRPGSVQPIIVSAANTDTVDTNGTLSNSDVRRYGFWVGGKGALTNQACFGPMWAMDTTTIAGGVAAEPVDVPAIIAAAADRKNRASSTLQGSNQMLCLQALQFGNGGTNPIYLKVNGAAIEFPSRKNVAKKQVNYNGTDNSVGWTFYPGASDKIDLSGTAFASANKYHWRIHASASASATWDFSGVALTGAGDVQLRAVTTFTGMSFTDCPTITTNGAAISNCSLTDSKLICAALSELEDVSDCAFVSSGTGHAVEVGGSASTIALSGNTFTGYAASNGSTGNEAIYVNIASGTVTINISGGGSTPSIRTAGATVIVQNVVTVKVTAKDADTAAAVQSARVLLHRSTGATVTITRSGSTATVTHSSHGYSNGQKVVIKGADQGEYNGLKTISNVTAGTYDYTVSGTPATPATGTITSYRVILDGDTDAAGIVQDTGFNYTADLAVEGRVRKGTSATYYKTSPLSGTITAAGLDLTTFLVKDT